MQKNYDIAIIGGGLAGLSLAILQAKAGKSVVVFEKNEYPFHRVCGEYISLESWDFLIFLGVPLNEMNLPIIKKLEVSSPKGTLLQADLDLGGFGISRYLLDFELVKIAKTLGVTILEKTRVENVKFEGDVFYLTTQEYEFQSKNAIGSFGKRSNLDVDWKRPFIYKNRTTLNQYIGVKYHVKADFPKDKIVLHNFKDGYCGFSAIENDTYCLCYLTTKSNVKASDNSIEKMEKQILSRNPHLKFLFENSSSLWNVPEVISQVSFEKKELVFNQMPMLGDASGVIAPLCGNGMSMAFQGAFLLNKVINENPLNLNSYQKEWQKFFGSRLLTGRIIQSMFGNELTTELLINFFRFQPFLLRSLIKLTHGEKIGD